MVVRYNAWFLLLWIIMDDQSVPYKILQTFLFLLKCVCIPTQATPTENSSCAFLRENICNIKYSPVWQVFVMF